MRLLRAALALAAVAGAASPAAARIVLLQTERGPVWTYIPEPAGSKLPSPTNRRLATAQLVDEAAAAHDVDASLIEAIIACESDFDARAVSSAGAQGLMQLMPDTQARYGVTDPFDAEQSIDAGARHLRDLLDAFGGDWKLTAAAYNAGEGAVRRAGGIPPYPETMHYVRKVQHYLSEMGISLAGDVSVIAEAKPEGVSFTGDVVKDPVLDWQPPKEPEPEPEPPRRKGPAAVVVRDERGRVVFTNRPEKAAGARTEARKTP